MLTKTSVSALRALLFLAHHDSNACLSPRRIAEALGESPTYLAKALRHLVKARLLRAEKGVRGGVRMAMRPRDITLLAIVEACQGAIVGDFCHAVHPEESGCAFHHAASELHRAITGVLSHWTLEDLLEKPAPSGRRRHGVPCLIAWDTRPPIAIDRLARIGG